MALLAAYLPSLVFLGHWPLRVDIPGTDLYVGLPKQAAHSHTEGHGHENHCHESAASCSDAPVVSTATVGLLEETISFQTDERAILAPSSEWWAPHQAQSIAPEPPPPRS
jgi:hypothetical protein